MLCLAGGRRVTPTSVVPRSEAVIARTLPPPASPFARAAPRLDPGKFADPARTLGGEPRARVALAGLTTLWFNTGTLCNLACANCYIESSPANDALAYLGVGDVERYLDEIASGGLPVSEIGFTGGEPFMNPAMPAMIALALARGFRVLVLTNAMRPLRRFEAALLELPRAGLVFRVSLDHHTAAVHDAERGPGSFAVARAGIGWLGANGFAVAIAGRQLPGEAASAAAQGYAALFEAPMPLVLFPEMDAGADVAEISEACWSILGVAPEAMMCASSRMVVRRRGAADPAVLACTLLAYDPRFELGSTLAAASGAVALNHPHCARFCVLGGASCSG